MAVVEMAMLAGLPYTRLRETVLARPTMAEGLGFLFSNENPVSAAEGRDIQQGLIDYVANFSTVAEPRAQRPSR